MDRKYELIKRLKEINDFSERQVLLTSKLFKKQHLWDNYRDKFHNDLREIQKDLKDIKKILPNMVDEKDILVNSGIIIGRFECIMGLLTLMSGSGGDGS